MAVISTNCGVTDYPWTLETKPGQKINLTLTYFQWASVNEDVTGCAPKLGYLFDLQSDGIVNICGSSSRVTHLHTTEGHKIQVLLDKATLQDAYFFIRYEGMGKIYF